MTEAIPPMGKDESGVRRAPGRRDEDRRAHRRLRMRRRGRRAYIRSVYFLPSMATLGNAICGFGAIYVAALSPDLLSRDRLTMWFAQHQFMVAAYLIFLAMVFDALDGRLARFARHTTDFGGQLDSLADVISFGAAPAFIALQLMKAGLGAPGLDVIVGRLIWAVGALYLSCAAMRLARFNVSNEHGEQHHFSFLGLPSPGAAAAVAGWILMQQEMSSQGLHGVAAVSLYVLPLIVLGTGLLMISNVRYPHMINRYLRGRRSIARLVVAVMVLLMLIVAHQYALGLGGLAYTLWGLWLWGSARIRSRAAARQA